MSRVRVSLLVFCLVIAVQFGDCEDTNSTIDCNEEIQRGSDKTIVHNKAEWLLSQGKNLIPWGKKSTIFKSYKKTDNEKVPRLSFSSSVSQVKEQIGDNFKAIFPGTDWCGAGDRAKNDSDLGRFNETDACCRAHDKCKNNILADETMGNLKNVGLFTRSACNCDSEFYGCLKKVNGMLSNAIGRTYFNILKPQCFECPCPADDCKLTDDSECLDDCKRYKWIDNPRF